VSSDDSVGVTDQLPEFERRVATLNSGAHVERRVLRASRTCGMAATARHD
jgi:hypothetical protein